MTKPPHIGFYLLIFLFVGTVSGRSVNLILQSRSRDLTGKSPSSECQCGCGNGTDKNSTSTQCNGTCGCGCSCCMSTKQSFTEIFPTDPTVVCVTLDTVYDDYNEAIGKENYLAALKEMGYALLSPIVTNAGIVLVAAKDTYKSSWNQMKLTKILNGNFTAEKIEAMCKGKEPCSDDKWSPGCMNCFPDENLQSNCSSPNHTVPSVVPPIREEPPVLDTDSSDCQCVQKLLDPLQEFYDELAIVEAKIEKVKVELDQSQNLADNIDKIVLVSTVLRELLTEMDKIIAKINYHIQLRVGKVESHNEEENLQLDQTLKRSHRDTSFTDNAEFICEDSDQPIMELVEALEDAGRLLTLSLTNPEAIEFFRCKAIQTMNFFTQMPLDLENLTLSDEIKLKKFLEEGFPELLNKLNAAAHKLSQGSNNYKDSLKHRLDDLENEKKEIQEEVKKVE